jgi:uncharacterized protein (TIGR02271 family)
MVTTDQVQHVLSSGGNVVDAEGSKIGNVSQVFLDDETGQPEWVTAKTGMFGGAESFIPLSGASVSGDDIQVRFDKAKVKDAPRVDDSEGHLDKSEEAELYRYYEMDYSESRSDSGLPSGGAPRDDLAANSTTGAGHDTSGPDTDSAMTRSEERLNVGTEQVSTGKVRLRKYVVTENVTKTVPVSHEEVRIEREPITDANRDAATSGADITEEEHEVELKGERVVVDKETVPVERVRMDKDVVTEDQQVTEEIRKEQIDTDTGSDRKSNR